jgi:uncharacterized protein
MAEQLEFFTVPSPCIGVCEVDNRGFCRGCFRSREERFEWARLNNSQRRNVIRLALNRRLRADKSRIEIVEDGPIKPDLF